MHSGRRLRHLRGIGLASLVGACLAGCQTWQQRLTSRDPLERARAVVELVDAGDAGAVHQLVNLLEDSDRAVRMYAILGLTHLCGTDYGYKYYGTDVERAAAVRRWRDALRAGEVVVRPRSSGGAAGPDEAAADAPSAENGTAGSGSR